MTDLKWLMLPNGHMVRAAEGHRLVVTQEKLPEPPPPAPELPPVREHGKGMPRRG